MASSTPRKGLRLDPTYWESPALRLVLLLLALGGALLTNRRLGETLVLASASYLVFSTVIWLVAGRGDWPWLAYLSGAADVAYVTLLIHLYPVTPVPLWVLYLLPMATASVAGRPPALAVTGLSLVGYLMLSWLPTQSLPAVSLWPLAVLAVGLAVVSATVPTWTPERREWRFWPEILAAARGLGRADSLNEAAALIVERARRLTRCDAAWLWWCDEQRSLRVAAVSGPATESAVPIDVLDEWTLERLLHGPIALTDLVSGQARQSGEVIALPYEDGMALLAVESERHRLRRAGRIARLHAFGPWASELLTQAQERDSARAHLAREQALAEAACDWAGTENPVRAQEAALRAIQAGLDATAAILERASGRVLLGDPTLPSSLDDQALNWLLSAPDPSGRSPGGSDPHAAEIVTVRGGLAIAVSRRERRLNDAELDWLDVLASGLSSSLERCGTHAAVEAEADRLRAAAEATPAPVALWNGDGKLLLANSAYSSLGLGARTPAELPLTEAQEVEMTAGTPPRAFMTTIVPIMGGSYVLAHYREVTREREALRAKDELIAMVGHELRSPLTSIRGYSQMMSRQLRIVQSQVTQLDALLSDFVEASRQESGGLRLSRSQLDLAGVVREVAERFRGAHEERVLRLTVGEDLLVDGDATRLEQVVDNLLGNAAKYSPADSAIELRAERNNGQVILSVRDEGAGIAPEHLPALFDRFYRVPGTADRVSGLGLGLSIVRDLVAAHGGKVWAESAGEGLGSTFWVALPAAHPTEEPSLEEATASMNSSD